MAYNSPLKLKLPEDIVKDVHRYLIDVTRAAIADNATRNEDLYRWRDQLRGFPTSRGEEIWPNSCQIEDGLCQEQYGQLLGPMTAPLKQSPLVAVSQSNVSDTTRAQVMETWLYQTWQKEGAVEKFAGFVQHAEYYPSGVLCIEWEEKKRKRRSFRMWDGETYTEEGERFYLQPGEAQDAEKVYEPYPIMEDDPQGKGRKYSVVPLWKFFPYPADVPSLDLAQATVEEKIYSDNDLLNGIEDFGFDKEKVRDVLKMGGRGTGETDDGTERNNQNFGVESATHTKSYPCYLFYGYLPKLLDAEGNPRLPRYLRNDLFCAVISLEADCVLKLEFSPYLSYPYGMASMLPEEGSLYGLGLALLLDSEQQEATHYRRVASNVADMVCSPMTIMADRAWELNRAQSWFPGGVLREEVPGSIRPYEMPNAGTVVGLQMVDWNLQRAQSKAATRGYGQVNPKQPLVAEMEGVLAATDVKFDLYQYNIYQILIWAAKKTLEYELLFNPTFQATIMVEGDEQTLSAEDIAETYDFSVAQINQNASQEAKIQKDIAIAKLVDRYFGFIQQTTGTSFAMFQVNMWRETRDALNHLDVRAPKEYIGEMPPPEGIAPPQPQIPPEMAEVLASLMGGDGGEQPSPQGQQQPPAGQPAQMGGMNGRNGSGQRPPAQMGGVMG